ncbi:MAG: hypothetical protein ACR2PS_03250 [Pseudomonadales bacterium]
MLLEVLTDPFGLSAASCVILGLVSFSMMLVGIARSSATRIRSAGLLVAGISYAALNVGLFALMVTVDAFKIFELYYILSVGFVAPALMISALVVIARRYKQLDWLSIVGLAIWVGCVGFAHLWSIAAASAGV